MPKKCNGCGRFTNAAEGAKCTQCGNLYHKACVKIPNEAQAVSNWVCPECKAQTPRKNNTETPVRGERAEYSSVQVDPSHVESTELLNEIKLMRRDMQAFRSDFNSLRDGLSAVRSAVEGLGGRLDGMEARLDALESKHSQGNPDTITLLETIEQLRSQIHERDQESFYNDVEISGIPEEQGENVLHLATTVAEKLGVSCEERDLVSVERAGMRRALSGAEAAPLRPRPLVIRLARHQLRDAFLQAARVRRGATTAGMGLKASPTTFYVNERLSKHNKMLFFEAREKARTHCWKYAWTRDGRIFVRQETGKSAFRVRSQLDLKKIFGSELPAAKSVFH